MSSRTRISNSLIAFGASGQERCQAGSHLLACSPHVACYRSTKADVVQGEAGLHKQASQAGITRMTKTTRFTDRPAQQEEPLSASLSHNMSGIPTGATAHWMVTRLMPWPSQNATLLLVLAAAIIALQVRSMTTASVPPVLTNPRTFASALCSAQQRMVGDVCGFLGGFPWDA